MPSVDEYRILAESGNFRSLQIWGENADRFFQDEEQMIRWIDQPCLVPFLPRVEDAAKGTFRDYVVRRMIDETKQPDGRCFETFRRVNVLAKK
jgi:trans-aconitate methyltransferase